MPTGRVTVTVDGNAFDAITVNFGVTTQKDQAGMPILQTLDTKARVWVDSHDTKNLPFGTLLPVGVGVQASAEGL